MPKTIVLLSDGTGNSAGKLFKTNVWQVYQALDLTAADVRAIYDDGVGTAHFKPLALLGGAVGLGLAQNVRDLYAFLCRNYQAGDAIYAFGFSRGAFTIRTLIGLVTTQGLVEAKSEAELHEKVRKAYRRHRKVFRTNWGLLRDWWQEKVRRGPTADAQKPMGQIPHIAFLGLWDTVAAYGLPIDELQQGWDRYFRALTFPDRELSPYVLRACHALSLDDERRTFHPVLWNERCERDPQRIKQVWFAGAHSDVGGGYPKDSLSYVPLVWIMREAERYGLHFKPGKLAELEARADPHGDLHDSRSGLGAYYRYAPRALPSLCHDDYNGVYIERPKIHERVFTRIKDGRVPYAPIGVPAVYDIVRIDGTIVPGPELLDASDEAKYESESRAQARAGTGAEMGSEERAWDFVWYRRLLYFTTLGASLFLIAFPAIVAHPDQPGCHEALCAVSSHVIEPVAMILPNSLGRWLQAFAARPNLFVAAALALLASMWLSRRVAERIRHHSECAWGHLKPLQPPPSKPYRPGLVYRIRSSRLLRDLYHWLTRSLAPLLFALALVVSGLLVLNHAAFAITHAMGLVCRPATAPRPVGAQPIALRFAASDPCFATGLTLQRGVAYRIDFEPEQPWSDGEIPVRDPLRGFTNADAARYDLGLGLIMYAATFQRRVLAKPWAQPMAKVGAELQPLAAGRFTPGTDGQLYLFANDAVLAIPWLWDHFYANNRGSARVAVSRAPPAR